MFPELRPKKGAGLPNFTKLLIFPNHRFELGNDIQTFFVEAPSFHPNSALIKGVVCGIRVEEVEDPLMKKIRYLDKLIDELAKGKALEKILRA